MEFIWHNLICEIDNEKENDTHWISGSSSRVAFKKKDLSVNIIFK